MRKFEEYPLETKTCYVGKYPWNYIPASVRKILEEVKESRNKDLKRFGEKHTRKINRARGNQGFLNRLLPFHLFDLCDSAQHENI